MTSLSACGPAAVGDPPPFAKPRVVVIAAPFGFGPAARALQLAAALHDLARVTLFSGRDALRFIERFRPPTLDCRGGVFESRFPGRAEMEEFDLFVSINNEPAVHHLVRHGLAARTVFLDSILPWRAKTSLGSFAHPIRAYLVQDFPGVAECLHTCRAQTVAIVAPLIWSVPGTRREMRATPARLTLHLGGITSPLMEWQTLRRPVEAIARRSVEVARRFGCHLAVIGSHRLKSLELDDHAHVDVLGDVDPRTAAEVIAGADLLLSTPGIGAIYEAFASGVPTVVLPPMNSTQLQHYRVYTAHGIPGSMHENTWHELNDTIGRFRWDRQAAGCVAWLDTHRERALRAFTPAVERLLDGALGASRRAELRSVQSRFFDQLVTTPTVDVVGQIVARL